MAKKQRTMRPDQMYSRRPTKGFQQNLSKSMTDARPPEMPDLKKNRIYTIIFVVIMVALLVVLNIFFKWWTSFIPLVIMMAASIFYVRYMNHKQMDLLSYYQKMGLKKGQYLSQAERQLRGSYNNAKRKKSQADIDKKVQQNMEQSGKMWDAVAGKDIKLGFFDKLMGIKIAEKKVAAK